MIQLGKIQTLNIAKVVDFGVYLAENESDENKVLLPKKQVPQGADVGDTISVFIYKDSKDRLIATTATPKLVMGQTAALNVCAVQEIGAFLDWGLEKDLFLPYKEQLVKVREGDCVLVRLYIDKSSRLCASMKELYAVLSLDSPYQTGDQVNGRFYEHSDNFGSFVAVDDTYSARLPKHEDTTGLRIGTVISARVTNVRPDGKLELSMREKAYLQMETDVEKILALLEERGGVFDFNDKASPERIFEETKLSKAAFKRGVGKLYKERKIEILQEKIVQV
ncbi:RNA-binding protein [Clostridia bacterium]|nr:RNA-binding protein [Clostridia bacterium]